MNVLAEIEQLIADKRRCTPISADDRVVSRCDGLSRHGTKPVATSAFIRVHLRSSAICH
jgi:hypothetical protein